MAGEDAAVTRLDFGTNVQSVVGQIVAELGRLDRALIEAGSAGDKATIGGQMVASLERLPAMAAQAGEQIRQSLREAMSTGVVPDKTLGRQFEVLINQARAAGEQIRSSLSESQTAALGGETAVQQQLAAPIEGLLAQLRTVHAEMMNTFRALEATGVTVPAQWQRLVSPSTTGKAVAAGERGLQEIYGAGGPLPPDALSPTIAATSRVATAFDVMADRSVADITRIRAEIAKLRAEAALLREQALFVGEEEAAGKQEEAKQKSLRASVLSTDLAATQTGGRAAVVGGVSEASVDVSAHTANVETLIAEGRNKEAVATANQVQAQVRLNSVRETGIASAEEEIAALRQLAQANLQLEAVTNAEAEAQTRQAAAQEKTAVAARQTAVAQEEAQRKQGIGGAFLGGLFGRGYQAGQAFDPSHAVQNLAGTVGVLARYGSAGVGIAALFQGLSEIRRQYLDYGSALANLRDVQDAVAHGQVDVNRAVLAGVPAGEGGATAVNTAAEAIARYRDEIHSTADENRIASETVRQVGQAMVLTGQDAKTTAGQLMDASQGFQLGSPGQQRVLDAIVNARHRFGGDMAQILQATSDAADLAESAGVDPEQLANIVALIQARTGSSASAVASAFERTVSRSGTGQFQDALSGLGVADTGDLVGEIAQMSEKYQTLTRVEQQHLISQLGGARQAKEILPLLQDGTQLLDANSYSYAHAGAAADLYARKQQTLAGQLRQIGNLLRDIALQVAQSGLLDVFGLAIEGLRPLLAGVDTLLRLFDQLPGSVRGGLAAILELALAARLLRGSVFGEVFAGAFGRVPVVRGILGTGPKSKAASEDEASTLVAGSKEAVGIWTTGAEEVVRIWTAGAGLGSEEQALANTTRREASALEGGEASALAKKAATKVEAGGIADASLLVGAGAGLAGLLPVAGAIVGLMAIGGIKSAMDHLHAAAEQGAAGLDELSKAQTVEEYKTAASNLQAAAEDQKRASSGIWGHVAGLIGSSAGPFNPLRTRTSVGQERSAAQYAQDEANRLVAAQADSQSALSSQYFGTTGHDVVAGIAAMQAAGYGPTDVVAGTAQALGVGVGSTSSSVTAAATKHGLIYNEQTLAQIVAQAQQVLGKDADPKKLRKAAVDALARYGIQPGDVIPLNVQNAIVGALVGQYYGQGPYWQYDPQRQKDTDTLRGKLIGLQTGTGALGSEDLTAILEDSADGKTKGLLSQVEGLQVDPTDATRGEAAFGNAYRSLRRLADRTPVSERNTAEYKKLIAAMDKAEDQYIQIRIANLESLRKTAVDRHPGSFASINRSFYGKEIAAAGDDRVQMANVLGQMTDAEVNYFIAVYKHHVAIAQAAVNRDKRLKAIVPHLAPEDRASVLAGINADQTALDLAKQLLSNLLGGAADSADQRYDKGTQDHVAFLQAQAQPGNEVSQAQTALKVARYQQSRARTYQEKENAIKAVNDAEYQLTQSHLSLAQAENEAKVIPGSEISAASVQLANAHLALKAAVPGTQAYYTALKGLHDAEYQSAQVRLQLAEAQNQAKVFPGSQIDAATAQIKNAHLALAAAVPGTQAYYAALGQLNQAQVAYSNALIDYHANQRVLRSDTTDPVGMARDEMWRAEEQLRRDKALRAPADVLAADQIKVVESQASAQKAAFDQQLQYEQTLYGLHQISGASYLKFLNTQQAALKAQLATMRKGTQGYQQTLEELLQVQQAIQGLNSQMQGQFNLGDIRIPTAYEMQRSIKTTSMGVPYNSTNVTNNNNQHFDFSGMDKPEVIALLSEVLGADTTSRTTTTTRKV